MKKTTLLIILLFLIAIMPGCYDGSDMATVKVNLGNLPVARQVENKSFIDRILCFFSREAVAQQFIYDNVTVVHLGSFDENNQLLSSRVVTFEQYPADNTVEFTVPAGIRRRIVVLGEGDSGFVGYYGVSDSLDFEAGSVATVTVNMNILDITYINLPSFNFTTATWDNVTGASGYNVYNASYELVQSSSINSYNNSGNFGDYYLEIVFGFSGKNSNLLSTYIS